MVSVILDIIRNSMYKHRILFEFMVLSHVKEGAIPTEIACKPGHGVSNRIANCCTGVRQSKVRMLKYKKV